MPRTVQTPHDPPAAEPAGDTGPDARTHVSGIVVHVVEEQVEAVAGWIDTLDGAEVAAREGGRLVVVLEAENEHGLADMVNRISLYDHVYSAALVSHFVDDPALAEPDTGEPQREDDAGG
jgi:nitrate reductase NapAB chaperone NapD